ncbi:PREDICTED: nucleolar and spindle-associated protein 1 isoform X6 [Propithecus coquereli]|uniref:Nucleolar and spindle associated protein 1 n=1 Tax=Propithecus coquereli TaxID=379532 RepID=A0A2K6FA12_PROCO|nr:PREDICTED: nucleolar and spindle-associated protein 1 isoform X6 [Propithecus coquereli]
MTVPSLEELDSFKYSDLQNLAKSLGLRANLRDESQTSASSCDETEINNQEQGEREPAGHVTKTRRRRKTVHGNPDSQQDHSQIKISDPTEFQNREKQENQDLSSTPSPSDESQGAENAVSSGKSNEDSKVFSERKKSPYRDEFYKRGKNKRTAITTPNFKKLHEAHFKEMESIDQYIERKKKHFEEHNLVNELKQTVNKGRVVTPVPPRGRISVACTPVSQQHSQGWFHSPASQSTLSLKGSVKCSAISATKTNVRFSAATKDNEHKRSLTKTPARKSARVTTSGIASKGQAVLGTHKTTKGNSAVIGKLKPWGQSKENNSLNEHVNRVNFHKKTYKQPRLQTREEQRKKHEQERKEKKAKVLGARRGLSMAED